MKTKLQILSIFGSLLFEYEAEDNTLTKTVQAAVKSSADLSFADLSSANLHSVNLSSANLHSADLSSANLHSVNLSSANLHSADLRSAKNLPASYINLCSRDMLFVFEHLKGELPAFREKLVAGKIDGTQYEGDCACLIGTMGNLDGGVDKVCSRIPFYDKGLHNYGEQWFWQIHQGDTPDKSFFAKHALELIDLVLAAPKVQRRKKAA
jgi:hypothetical protein